MKALALLTAVAVTLFSVAASAQTYVGKGKPRRRRLLPKARQVFWGTSHRAGPLPFFWIELQTRAEIGVVSSL
jgi:hypothetical protein